MFNYNPTHPAAISMPTISRRTLHLITEKLIYYRKSLSGSKHEMQMDAGPRVSQADEKWNSGKSDCYSNTHMDARKFFDTVAAMRERQKAYFKYRRKSDLNESKRLEGVIDAEIERVKALLGVNTPTAPQQASLFGDDDAMRPAVPNTDYQH